MSFVAYTTCAINFIPNDKHDRKRSYSDRSVIELLQHDFGNYLLRGTDVQNNKAPIFGIQLTSLNKYKLGSSINDFDEIRCPDGTYYFLLNLRTRDQFHEALKSCFKQLDNNTQKSFRDSSGKLSPDQLSSNSPNPRTIGKGNEILIDIHNLSECIENGDADKAVKLASKLASQHVQIKAKILDKKIDNERLQIRVKIDGINLSSEEHVLQVYRSTAIHELQAVFQYTHNFPMIDQYFFVHGHLAHTESTMNDLNIEDNAFFVLFINQKKQEEDNHC